MVTRGNKYLGLTRWEYARCWQLRHRGSDQALFLYSSAFAYVHIVTLYPCGFARGSPVHSLCHSTSVRLRGGRALATKPTAANSAHPQHQSVIITAQYSVFRGPWSNKIHPADLLPVKKPSPRVFIFRTLSPLNRYRSVRRCKQMTSVTFVPLVLIVCRFRGGGAKGFKCLFCEGAKLVINAA